MSDSTRPLARLSQVSKRYGSVTALDAVDLAVMAGQTLALLGPNGAGKSTAIGLMLGLLAPDSGQVHVFGRDPQQATARQHIGVMLQSAVLPATLTVRELIALVRSYYPNPDSIENCARTAGITDLLWRRCGKLSGGQQRRVQFALAICGRPALLFLDEPTTGLDIEARQAIWAAIGQHVARGGAVLLTTHYLEEADALADRVAVLMAARIVAEGPAQTLRAQASQRRIRCLSALPAEEVASWPEVTCAHREGAHLHIVADSPENVLRQLLVRDAALSELEIQRASLTDVFLHLTGDAARREAA